MPDKICVLSDTLFVTTEISELLKFVGYNIIECEELEEFIKQQDNVQLVIMYSKKVQKVFDWVKVLKTDSKLRSIPIIFVVDEKNYNLLSDAYQIGISDYLELPVVDIELISKVALHVELKKNREHIENLYIELKENLNLATEVQKLMMPSALFAKNNLWFTSHYLPAQVVGGDIYDYFDLDGEIVGYIADISGHGIQSALLCSAVKSIVRSSTNRTKALSEIINELSASIKTSLAHNYITGIFFKISFDGTVEYINCGHPPIITYDGKVFREIKMKNALPIGLFDYEYNQDDIGSFNIEEGLSYILYSDGLYSVFEKNNPVQSTIDTLFDFLNKEISGIPKEILPFYIRYKLNRLYSEIPDDFSIVCFGKSRRYVYIDKDVELYYTKESIIDEIIKKMLNYTLSEEYIIFYNEHEDHRILLCKDVEIGYILKELPTSLCLNFGNISAIKLFTR